MPSYSSNSFERVLADLAPKSSIGVFWVFNGHVAEIHEWSVCNDCCSPPFLFPLLCICSRAAILDLTIVNGVLSFFGLGLVGSCSRICRTELPFELKPLFNCNICVIISNWCINQFTCVGRKKREVKVLVEVLVVC